MVTRTPRSHRSRSPAAAALLACVALAGCDLITDSFATNEFSGDAFPIQIGRESGAVLIGARDPGEESLVAVLDVLSPVTLVDPGPGEPKTIGTADLMLLGRSAAGGPFDVPRALLRDANVISLHPCLEDPDQPACVVGRPGMEHPYGAIIGANVLAGDALRLRLGDDQVFVLADIGGDERDRTFACDAVFPSPYRGGGTLLIAGTEVSFGGRRVTLQACLGADPDAEPDPTTGQQLPQGARGADALLVMSTGIGVSLLSEIAYERYRQAILLRRPLPPVVPPPLAELPDASAFLPSGPVFGRRVVIDRLALAAASSSSPRAPCRQAFAHHFLLQRNCSRTSEERLQEDCPCTGDVRFCSVPAVVELDPIGGFEVLVVPDANPTLQALRAELRPDQAEVDGILGADALVLSEIDVDYPHNRVLMRCTASAPACVTRPALAAEEDRTQVQNCIDSLVPP